jgi:hypothetical protein
MDEYSQQYGKIADPVWETEFADHPVKQKRTRTKR